MKADWKAIERRDGSVYLEGGNPATGSPEGHDAFDFAGSIEHARDFVRAANAHDQILTALKLAREGWKCETCGGLGYYAEPVHACGGDPEMCQSRCPEAEQTQCERCAVIDAAIAKAEEPQPAPVPAPDESATDFARRLMNLAFGDGWAGCPPSRPERPKPCGECRQCLIRAQVEARDIAALNKERARALGPCCEHKDHSICQTNYCACPCHPARYEGCLKGYENAREDAIKAAWGPWSTLASLAERLSSLVPR